MAEYTTVNKGREKTTDLMLEALFAKDIEIAGLRARLAALEDEEKTE